MENHMPVFGAATASLRNPLSLAHAQGIAKQDARVSE